MNRFCETLLRQLPWFLSLPFLTTLMMQSWNPAQAQQHFAIAIHGGAGDLPEPELQAGRLAELNRVLDMGLQMLRDGKASLDVVEAVTGQLEDCELFNAGRGCVLNEQGEHELDASIMDGRTLACGAVAGVKTVRNPISLARLVMSSTRHVLLSGSGADELGRQMNLPQADAQHFVTERQLQRYLKWKKASSGKRRASDPDYAVLTDDPQRSEDNYYGTVGCVALDLQGNLAAGTSTGGLMGKRWGRIGDSPIIGAGNYADNATCAVSGTGIGEEFIRFAIAGDIAARMRYAGRDLDTAAKESLARLPEDCGGVICVDQQGNAIARHNTSAMSFALANSRGLRVVQLSPPGAK